MYSLDGIILEIFIGELVAQMTNCSPSVGVTSTGNEIFRVY